MPHAILRDHIAVLTNSSRLARIDLTVPFRGLGMNRSEGFTVDADELHRYSPVFGLHNQNTKRVSSTKGQLGGVSEASFGRRVWRGYTMNR